MTLAPIACRNFAVNVPTFPKPWTAMETSVIGLPLSGTLLKLDGVMGIAGWRWLFLLEGLPAIALAAIVLWYLPDIPAKAPWLNDGQKAWLIGVLKKEDA